MKPDEAEQLQQEVEDQVDNLQKKIAKPNEESEISSEQGTPSASRSNSTSQLSNSDDKSKNMVNQLFSSIQFWKSSQPKPERPPKSATQTLTRSDSKTSLKPHYPTEKSAEEGSLVTPDDQPQTSKEKFLTLFKIFINTFGLIFIAEWGDRSQLATIVLASTNDVGGIILGSIVGHTICSSLAVIAGALIARWISVRVVTVIGGIVFISFAIASLIIGFEDPASAIDDLWAKQLMWPNPWNPTAIPNIHKIELFWKELKPNSNFKTIFKFKKNHIFIRIQFLITTTWGQFYKDFRK